MSQRRLNSPWQLITWEEVEEGDDRISLEGSNLDH